MDQNASFLWYQQLVKPAWAPPSFLFGPVWTVLYLLIALSFGYIFIQVLKKKLPLSLSIPFIINLLSNVIFTPLQFGIRNYVLATVDIFVVLLTILWIMRMTFNSKRVRWVAYMQIPYLMWVMFATALQVSITYLNW